MRKKYHQTLAKNFFVHSAVTELYYHSCHPAVGLRVRNWTTRPIRSHVGSNHYFHTCRPTDPAFPNRAKQSNVQVRIVIATGGAVGLAEWITDGTHVCIIIFCCSYRKTWNATLTSRPSLSLRNIVRHHPSMCYSLPPWPGSSKNWVLTPRQEKVVLWNC